MVWFIVQISRNWVTPTVKVTLGLLPITKQQILFESLHTLMTVNSQIKNNYKKEKKNSLHLDHGVREVTNKILNRFKAFISARHMSMLHKLSYIQQVVIVRLSSTEIHLR